MSNEGLSSSVKRSGAGWEENPYYANAEKYTPVFWGEGTLFRQLFARLQLDAVLELACGHGRHSFQIKDKAKKLILMDIHESNIAASQRRLAGHPDCTILLNNGYDFQPVANESLTAIFCYDAMVHFEPELVESYIKDSARVLKPAGMALFHHSNLIPPEGNTYGQNPGWRNRMNQLLFQRHVVDAGLCVLHSTVISWGGVAELDCVSLIQKPAKRGPAK